MSALLGLTSFGCGALPLSFVFSKSHLERLGYLGTGLLLGAALGVIIPEGIEAVADANPSESELPINHVSLSLLFGFFFMLVVEQLLTPHSHSHPQDLPLHHTKEPSIVEFDAEELGELENHAGRSNGGYHPAPNGSPRTGALELEGSGDKSRAVPLTIGLIVHGLADGLALGVSSTVSLDSSNVSFIVFLALIIHKAPTALALTTSLLATSLPRADCKKHLAAFSASTPVGAIVSYLLFSFFGGVEGKWTGIALLISGGTFLYVATVLQPVSHSDSNTNSGNSNVTRPSTRVLFISFGMFIPFTLGAILGHGH
ncbi:Zinc/iron permease [Pluteus cervinus]|uniref:Zinc/iron permease n=1 Tax=Pluteus cervinus TaxID=181527 RepID=A0ACD3B9E2_9AGAR|nr:Zinc/iron permease [Pluteus cervinus]